MDEELAIKRLGKVTTMLEEAMAILIKLIPGDTMAHEMTDLPVGMAHRLVDDSRELIDKIVHDDEEEEGE